MVNAMEREGILVIAQEKRTIAEEMPDAYKDVDIITEGG